jgi:Icc-related predicted phosphoesterase
MQITFISDTHTLHDYVTQDLPGGDMIIHAGDVSSRGIPREINEFLEWFSSLNYKYKIFIAGNHDFGFELPRHSREKDREIVIPDNVIYLQDDLVEIEGIKIYGTPWQPRFYNWAFNVDRGEAIAQKWKLIPEGIDILVTHGPPYSILDKTQYGDVVGCEELYKRVFEVKPKINVFGHIHEGYGIKEIDGVWFINASVLNHRYRYTNEPVVITYPLDI